MSRHLQYLNCLRANLSARYGDDDDAVREVDSAIKTLEEVESRHRATFGAPVRVQQQSVEISGGHRPPQ